MAYGKFWIRFGCSLSFLVFRFMVGGKACLVRGCLVVLVLVLVWSGSFCFGRDWCFFWFSTVLAHVCLICLILIWIVSFFMFLV